MITIIRDNSIEETSYCSFLGRFQKIKQKHIEKIEVDHPNELELALLGAAHQERKVIDDVLYEPVHSDNINRVLRDGERAKFVDGRSWLPVRQIEE